LSADKQSLTELLEKKKRELLVLKRAAQAKKPTAMSRENIPPVEVDINPAPLKVSMDDSNLQTSFRHDPGLLEAARVLKQRY
jgi:hypothetical protein